MNGTPSSTRTRTGLLVGGVLGASAFAAGLVVFGSLACSGDGLRSGLSGPTPSTPEELLTELKQDKARIDQVTDQMMKRIETFNASRRPGERTLQFSEIFYEDLSADQRDVLNAMVAEEKDVSYRSLLTKIIEDRDSIRTLQDRVLHLEQNLPDRFVLARKGDTHNDLALDYLLNEAKVDAEKAKTLLREVDQTDELLPGNKVWFFYDAGRDNFRTYVTQGEAGQTPLVVRRAVKRQLITERDEALARVQAAERQLAELQVEIEAVNTQVAALTERRSQLEMEVASLQQNKAQLEANVARLSSDLAFRENSLFYHAARERDLKEQGVLSTVLKRVRDVKGVTFDEAIDLRHATTITLAAPEFGLEKIKDVRLLPSIYQAGRDFAVETTEDGAQARVVFLDPTLFRGKEVLLAVRG